MSDGSRRAPPERDARDGSDRLDPRVLATLFRLEMKLLLRDRRTLFIAVVLPLVIFPVVIFIMRAVSRSEREKLETTEYEYAVVGSEAELARALVRQALALEPEADDSALARGNFRERTAADPDSLLLAGELHLVIEGLSPDEYREEVAARDSARPAGPEEIVALPVVRIKFRVNSELSREAWRRMRDRLRALRMARRDSLLRDRGLPLDPRDLARLEFSNVAPAEKEGGALLGRFLTALLVMLMLTGGSIVAADAISGEKERGTIETLLTTAARRSEIVAAKLLAVVAVGLTITIINVANLLVYVVSGLFELPEQFAVRPEPLAIAVIMVLYLPLAAIVAAALLLLSGYSKTYREYQIYFFPVFMLFLIPSAAAVLPGIDLRSAIAVIPVANVSVAVREVLIGEYDWLFLAMTFAVTAATAYYTSRLTARTLSTERLITAAELDEADLLGGPALFPKRVLRWFAIFWVALFLSSLWLGGTLGIRGRIALSVLGVFLGGSLLIIRRYRLDPREVLALRPVRAPVWAAVLIGAPSAFLVGAGVARLANFIFPVPERLIESFGQYLLAPELALWEVLLFLAVLPGIFEEVAFRGVLLHGLRRRFHPAVLCLVVGGIFGLFHVDLFRIIPTAFLGTILAAVTLITGSIFPAMLWHALNNAVALVPAYYDVWTGSPPLWSVPLGGAGLALAFWILWRYRGAAGITGRSAARTPASP